MRGGGCTTVVLGAGLGGLSAAIYARLQGHKVVVVESNSEVGGKASEIAMRGFRFDTGPSLLTMPWVVENVFADADKNMADYISLIPLQRSCRYYYSDRTFIDAFTDKSLFAREVAQKTTDSPVKLQKYFEYVEQIYDLVAPYFLYNELLLRKHLINWKFYRDILRIGKADIWRTMTDAIDSFFIDKKLRQIFYRYATFNGSTPFRAPATLNVIAHVEASGAYAVQGGIRALPLAMKRLAMDLGVNFSFEETVCDLQQENGVVTAVVTEKRTLTADRVISNIDVIETYRLLGKKYDYTSELSTSALVFCWGVQGDYSQKLDVHNILFSDDYQHEFAQISDLHQLADDPTVYINITSRYNPHDAPLGYENWFVMINVPFDQGENWSKAVEQQREIIYRRIRSNLDINIKDKIICEKIITPQDIGNKLNSYRGALYGLASNDKFSAFRRHSATIKGVKNIRLCGGSVHPGGGMPLAIISGKLATNYENNR